MKRVFKDRYLLCILVVLVVSVAGVVISLSGGEDKRVRFSTGFPGGTYNQLGDALSKLVVEETETISESGTLESSGSWENLERLQEHQCDFAFVQGNEKVDGSVRLVAPLYKEVLHFVVRKELAENWESLFDLDQGQDISVGYVGSGAKKVVDLILSHFDLKVPGGVQNIEPDRLITDLGSSRIDAAFVLLNPTSEIARSLFSSDRISIIGISPYTNDPSPIDSIARLHPAFSTEVLPPNLYGKNPAKPVTTLSVRALLVTRSDIDDSLVRCVVSRLYENRAALSEIVNLSGEAYDPKGEIMPFHEGAISYYVREEPSFFVQYAESISLILTLFVGAWSSLTLFVRWRKSNKKENIDKYYARIMECKNLPPEEQLDELRLIHQEAFHDLMDERLGADSSFIIFHDFIRDEMNQLTNEGESGE